MKFKNQFEEAIYKVAVDVFGEKNTNIKHNEVIQIEDTSSKSVITFSGPPKKEIDILSVTLSDDINIQLLVSCKDFNNMKAEPSHVQEWCAVVNTFNKHSVKSKYIGIVISSSGFTSGCEGWATSENIGLFPPLKGNNLKFEVNHITAMFKRFCLAISKRLLFPFDDILLAPNFFDFCYSITSDFEGFINANLSSRYKILETNWNSNFSEFVRIIIGKKIISIIFAINEFLLLFEDNFVLKYSNQSILFGRNNLEIKENENVPICSKNINNEHISFEELKKNVIGKKVTSAADFQSHIELGINNELNFGIVLPNKLYVLIFNDIQK